MNSTELIKFCELHGFDPEAYGANYWMKRFEDWEDREEVEKHMMPALHAIIIAWIGDKFRLWLHPSFSEVGIGMVVYSRRRNEYFPFPITGPSDSIAEAHAKGIVQFLKSYQTMKTRWN